ncbi:FAD-dependent oxidoreductase [Pseudorhodoferax soli]|uniref:Monoamine oxidase n=1 Tax=Pseudorhodoferax soli TaxID=545864 RepID=A0A368X8X1_9BURK|nr:FAD-dependent oxidoreductase [Pseudorhodoferax soli]RCW63438.1 monoamine oxidase [Pseudorhodoferax soli]
MISRRAWLAGAALPLLATQGCDAPDTPLAGGFVGTSPERGHLLRSAMAQRPARTQRTRVVIAGGGVAGLAAARALRQRGIEDFVLLELEDQAGGNSRATQLGGLPCPLGAHYLPLPMDAAHEVQGLLEEFGLRQRVAGRWEYDERHLCHSPQERLYRNGHWQDGLLPLQDIGAGTLAQYRRFAARVAALMRSAPFALPAQRAAFAPEHAALDAQTMAQWLGREGLDDAQLHWYLDYCCRDDFGAGLAGVSAWAGIHYFASRHGFHAPGDAEAEREAVLTWPEGNAWLTQRLAQPLGERLRCARVVSRIATHRQGVTVQALDTASGQLEQWDATHCIVALPVFVAARVLAEPPACVREAAAALRYSPWLVANVHLRAALADQGGAAPSWDNVVYGSNALGYVDAGHQGLEQRRPDSPRVLSWYHALGLAPDARNALLQQPWQHWAEQMFAELREAHPDLRAKATHIAITRYGHAMATPVPGLVQRLRANPATPRSGPLLFAHADWSGYSVFEEAFTRGHLAGLAAG